MKRIVPGQTKRKKLDRLEGKQLAWNMPRICGCRRRANEQRFGFTRAETAVTSLLRGNGLKDHPRLGGGATSTSAPSEGGVGGGAAEAAPAVDLKVLHAKIGELTLENDFLAGALSKAGLLSAKR